MSHPIIWQDIVINYNIDNGTSFKNDRELLAFLYKKFGTVAKAGNHLGIHRDTLRARMVKLNIDIKSKSKHQVTNKDIVKYLETHTYKETKDHFKISQWLIYKAKEDSRSVTRTTKPKEEELCACCKTQPRASGFRFLCYGCYHRHPVSNQATV